MLALVAREEYNRPSRFVYQEDSFWGFAENNYEIDRYRDISPSLVEQQLFMSRYSLKKRLVVLGSFVDRVVVKTVREMKLR